MGLCRQLDVDHDRVRLRSRLRGATLTPHSARPLFPKEFVGLNEPLTYSHNRALA